MDQPLVIGIVMLLSFGITGVVLGALWRRPPFRLPRILALAAGVAAVLGLWLVFLQVEHLEEYMLLRGWTSVPGVIIDSRVIGERAYRPEIVYQYSVDDRVYRDSTSLDPPGFGGRNAKRDAAEGVASEYPVGKAVVIHYNPSDPTDSRLKITPPWSVYGKTGFGGFLFGAGLFLTALYLGQQRRRAR